MPQYIVGKGLFKLLLANKFIITHGDGFLGEGVEVRIIPFLRQVYFLDLCNV